MKSKSKSKSKLSSTRSTSSEGTCTTNTTTPNTITPIPKFQVGNRIESTLEPCVVLMKDLISKHSHKWDDDNDDNDNGNGGGGIYSLAQGVVYWQPPHSAYDAIRSAIDMNMNINNDNNNHASEISNSLHQYCPDEGLPSLITAIKHKLYIENNLPLNTTNVIITNGANQAYMNCILSLLSESKDQSRDNDDDDDVIQEQEQEQDVCVVFKPYYFNHVMAVQMVRGDDALLVGPIDDRGYPDIDWLRHQMKMSMSMNMNMMMESQNENENENENGEPATTTTETKKRTRTRTNIRMVTITNPGNPTGVSLPKNKLQEIVDLCREYNCWLVMDNTYEHFDHTHVNSFPISTAAVQEEEEEEELLGYHCFQDEHVINIFSFSKGYAMAGFRVGYVAINNNRDLYQQMIKVQDTIPICTSRISQLAAQGALTAGRSWVIHKVRTLNQGRQAILNALHPLETIGGSGAMYVMAKLPQTNNNNNDDRVIGELFVEKFGIAIIPGSFCGYPGWIRVCYSNLPPEDCIIAAGRLEKAIQSLFVKNNGME